MGAERWELETEDEIQAARKAVAKAMTDYRKGGSPDAVNKANMRLANAHQERYCVTSGRVPSDDR